MTTTSTMQDYESMLLDKKYDDILLDDFSPAYFKGIAHLNKGNYAEALKPICFHAQVFVNDLLAQLYAAEVSLASGYPERAFEYANRAYSLNPAPQVLPSVLGMLAITCMLTDRLDIASIAISEACRLAPQSVPFKTLSAQLEFVKGDRHLSLELFEQLHAKHLTDDTLYNLALATGNAGRHEESAKLLLRLDPHYRNKQNLSGTPANPNDLPDKIYIPFDQGAGDVINLLPHVKRALSSTKITWGVPQSLAELLKPEETENLKFSSQAYDGITPWLSTIYLPAVTGYTPVTMQAYLPRPCKSEGYVGICHAGHQLQQEDSIRSLDDKSLSTLINKLQAKTAKKKIDLTFATSKYWSDVKVDWTGSTFADLANLISKCDYVISVDTAVAHVAGAIGVPCKLLLKSTYDWRYATTKGPASIWEGQEVFVQQRPFQWDSAITKLIETIND